MVELGGGGEVGADQGIRQHTGGGDLGARPLRRSALEPNSLLADVGDDVGIDQRLDRGRAEQDGVFEHDPDVGPRAPQAAGDDAVDLGEPEHEQLVDGLARQQPNQLQAEGAADGEALRFVAFERQDATRGQGGGRTVDGQRERFDLEAAVAVRDADGLGVGDFTPGRLDARLAQLDRDVGRGEVRQRHGSFDAAGERRRRQAGSDPAGLKVGQARLEAHRAGGRQRSRARAFETAVGRR